jgi:hypothetical protein
MLLILGWYYGIWMGTMRQNTKTLGGAAVLGQDSNMCRLPLECIAAIPICTAEDLTNKSRTRKRYWNILCRLYNSSYILVTGVSRLMMEYSLIMVLLQLTTYKVSRWDQNCPRAHAMWLSGESLNSEVWARFVRWLKWHRICIRYVNMWQCLTTSYCFNSDNGT